MKSLLLNLNKLLKSSSKSEISVKASRGFLLCSSPRRSFPVTSSNHRFSYSTMTTSTENRLAKSKSPYLLQHKHNPVDWYEWGDEAFSKAKTEGKLVFLSIGYSACHWCHVMAHESFENQEIADQMNELFINIKVDREERPDVDASYMAFVQALSGRGGWPLSAFLTPGGQPIFGGTYFSPKQFENSMDRLSDMWSSPEGRRQCLESADSISDALKASSHEERPLGDLPSPSVVMKAVQHWRQSFDEKNKGEQRSRLFDFV